MGQIKYKSPLKLLFQINNYKDLSTVSCKLHTTYLSFIAYLKFQFNWVPCNLGIPRWLRGKKNPPGMRETWVHLYLLNPEPPPLAKGCPHARAQIHSLCPRMRLASGLHSPGATVDSRGPLTFPPRSDSTSGSPSDRVLCARRPRPAPNRGRSP